MFDQFARGIYYRNHATAGVVKRRELWRNVDRWVEGGKEWHMSSCDMFTLTEWMRQDEGTLDGSLESREDEGTATWEIKAKSSVYCSELGGVGEKNMKRSQLSSV